MRIAILGSWLSILPIAGGLFWFGTALPANAGTVKALPPIPPQTPPAQQPQEDEQNQAGEAEDREEDQQERPSDEAAEEIVEAVQPETSSEELRLHMFDGTVITGKLATEAITVDTEYGTLKIPVEDVMKIVPGLDSYPHIQQRIDQLVEQLGSGDYNQRQAARKALEEMGTKIKLELDRYSHGGNAERKKHLEELREQITQLELDALNFDEEPEPPYIRGDSVTTPSFTVVGKIQQSQFQVQSKYGELTVRLQDIERVDRRREGGREVRRVVNIAGENFMPSNPKSSGIKVNRGDIVTVSASGTISMTPWGRGRVSTPDGDASFGWYINGQIPGGALCAMIGDGDDPIEIGSRQRFVAKRSGILKFGMGIPPNYANRNYQFPGQYRVKVHVRPGD